MTADAVADVLTAEELGRLKLPGKSAELVRGRLIVREPPGAYHGQIAARLAYLVGAHVYPNGLGPLFGQDTGFLIETNPDTVRAPDLAFLRAERAAAIRPRGYGALAPDLVVEIVSPDDRRGELLAKVGQWIDAGVRLVWVLDPMRREAHVHRLDGSLTVLDASGTLDGEDVIPGLALPLSHALD